MLKTNLVSVALIGLSLSGASIAANFPVVDAAGLISAINTANTNNQNDVIDLQGNTITLSVVDNNTSGPNGLPAILSDSSHALTIENGVILRNPIGMIPEFRHIYVSSGANLTVDHVIFENGLIVGDGQDTPLNYAASIYNDSILTILNSTFYQNNAARGGAVFNHEPNGNIPLISHSEFIENTNSALANQSYIDRIINTRFIDNSATTSGGAISIFSSTINEIIDSTFEGNTAQNGGAIKLGGTNPTINTIAGSTFNNNVVSGRGGAISDQGNGDADNGNIDRIYNSTFYGNTASYGGAINLSFSSVNIYNSTLTNNLASTQGGAINFDPYTPEEAPTTSFDLWSSVVSENSSPSGPDLFVDAQFFPGIEGFNLIGNNAQSGIVAGDPNANQSQVGTPSEPFESDLAPLADNGGPTKTQALFSKESRAFNRGTNSELNLEFDQRGYPRVENGATDVGAFEFLAPEPRKKHHNDNDDSDHGGGTVGFLPNPFPPQAIIPPLAAPSVSDSSQSAPEGIANKGHRGYEPSESQPKSSGCSNTDAPSFMMLIGLMTALLARRQKKNA